MKMVKSKVKLEFNEVNLIDLEKARYEKKFIIPLDKKEIELIIKENPSMFSEIFYERRVNNIYLDSLGMRSFFEHISGFDERLKIRIRWYGKMFGFIEKPELEIKVKKNEFGNKIRFPLKPFSLDKNFSFSELKKVFFQSNLPRWIEEELRLSKKKQTSIYIQNL